MTKNTYSANVSRETNKKNTNRFHLLMLTVMCAVIFAVSFMAFLKIENNLHALLILAVGTALNAFIFINGKNQAKR